MCAIAVGGYILTRGHDYRYRLVFTNASQLVKGDLVRIGGTPVGDVREIKLSDDYQAEVVVTVNGDYAPLHEGTTATIRQQGLTAVASRYVDISPASEVRPALPDGALIGGRQTSAVVEIDQLFNTLDPGTRKGLRRLIRGSASWYDGREQAANRSAKAFPGALNGLRSLAQEITRDNTTFEQFLVKTGDAMAPLADRSAELTDLIGNARGAARALGSDTNSLSVALRELPPALDAGSNAFAALRPALTDLRHLTDVTGPATRDLEPFLRQLEPVVSGAVPTFHELRTMFAQPGPANDALDALRDLPPLASLIKSDFPNAKKALRDSTPVFEFVRPYTPDLIGWVRSFGSTMATYDANGHYARTSATFDAFSFIDDANGGRLEPKAPADRGRSPYLSTDNLMRCPGSAALPPADGSAPFVDDGPLANPDCDPKQRVGATP